MGKCYAAIGDEHRAFIEAQRIFFVGTADCDGRVNVSPKGMDTLRVLGPNHAVWLNLTGSGNETAAHLLGNDRMTLMFCAFEGRPLVLRLYGHARALHPRDPDWAELAALFPSLPGARQVMDLRVDLVQSSCGTGVPLFDYAGDREAMIRWAGNKGPAGIHDYWTRKNAVSIDGKPTRITE